MVHQAKGRAAAAQDVIEGAIAFLLETGNTTQLPVILALQAEVALMQGTLSTASEWAEKLDPVPPLVPMPWFLAPHLTLVKVWLAQNTPTSREKAAKLLEQLREYLLGIHNRRFLIDTFALQALLAETTGEHPTALELLERALRLAQPGEFIRLFVDMGPQMTDLLSRLKPSQGLRTYVDKIRAAFPAPQGYAALTSPEKLLEPLTNRELQILELLRGRLTNKEIATQLVISPGTVKWHTIRIYDKLDVNGRRQAVEKAIKLGILASK